MGNELTYGWQQTMKKMRYKITKSAKVQNGQKYYFGMNEGFLIGWIFTKDPAENRTNISLFR